MKEKRNEIALLPMIADIICILAGFSMLCFKEFEMKYISIGLVVALLVCGVMSIVFYFTREAYKRVMDYSFSVGVLMIAFACCIIARLSDVSGQMHMILAVVALTLSVVILQNAIQMKTLKSKVWGVALVISLALILANVVLIVEPAFIRAYVDSFLMVMLIATGALGLIFMLVIMVEIKLEPKRTEKLSKMAESNEKIETADAEPTIAEEPVQEQSVETSYESTEYTSENVEVPTEASSETPIDTATDSAVETAAVDSDESGETQI
ncbi:MAG: hypothetical protein K6F37_00355 [Lachnospiraceae bacterium]|nr:hypothetical protein [Lachnospiraceae bacterium]